MNRVSRYFRIPGLMFYNFLFWVLLALLHHLQIVSGNSAGQYSVFWWPFSGYLLIWVLSIPAIHFYIISLRYYRASFFYRQIIFSLLYASSFFLLFPILSILLERLFLPNSILNLTDVPQFWTQHYTNFLIGFLMYCLLFFVLRGLTYYRNFSEKYTQSLNLESELKESRLSVLKMQLNPHFLFNALNTASMLVRNGKSDKAITMISNLSDLLRNNLYSEHKQLIPLSEEIELTKKYIEIESVRYGDRVKIDFDIDTELDNIKIPSMVLQMLVENGFKHGISQSSKDETMVITIKKLNAELILHVFNSGKSKQTSFTKSKGIGHKNISDRLSAIYKSGYKFTTEETQFGYAVNLELPIND